jgi:hypothetical protein
VAIKTGAKLTGDLCGWRFEVYVGADGLLVDLTPHNQLPTERADTTVPLGFQPPTTTEAQP